jgi:uncharacterized membrane protein
MKRSRFFYKFLYAWAIFIGIIFVALGTIWALLEIGEGNATIKFREYGVNFTLGGTFGLFCALITLYTRTFRALVKIVSSILVVSVVLNGYVMINEYIMRRDAASLWLSTPKPNMGVLQFSLTFGIIISIIIIMMWFVFRRWRDLIWTTE